ncbi:MAG: hypothetical protein AB1791_06850 [Chloroflexota bacterium]
MKYGFVLWLLLLTACARPPAATPTTILTVAPTASPTAAPTLTAAPSTPTPATTAATNLGRECLNRAIERGRPQDTADLMIFVGVVLEQYEAVITTFNELARPCDGLAFAAERATDVDWRAMITDAADTTLIWWVSPSLALAQETADQWAGDVDWFAYGPVLEERLTPAGENEDLITANRQASALARQHDLVYSVGPSYQLIRRYAADLATDADIFVTQNYAFLREDPAGLVPFIEDVDEQIRAVNPTILLIPTFGTHLPEDDPQQIADFVRQMLGHIDGIYVRTSGKADSLEKLATLMALLRN